MSRSAIKCVRTVVLMILASLCYDLSPVPSNCFSWLGVSEAGAGQANLPDLVVTNVSDPPERGNAGVSFWVNNTITNIGSGNANSSTTQYFLFDPDNPSDVLVGSRSVRNLKRGASYTGPTVPVTIPLNTTQGTYYLVACADGTESITESNETNNCESSGEAITVLARVILSADSTPIPAGGKVTVAWTEIASPALSDWIALYTPGSSNIDYIASNYLNCSQTQPLEPISSGSCQFSIPDNLAAGTYEFRLFAGPISATSNAITVAAP